MYLTHRKVIINNTVNVLACILSYSHAANFLLKLMFSAGLDAIRSVKIWPNTKNLTICSPIVTKVEHGLNKFQLKRGNPNITRSKDTIEIIHNVNTYPGPSFIKPDQLDPRIKDQLRNALLSTILSLQLPNFVSCGRACPSHMTQNLVTVGAKLWTGEWFSFDPWSLDQADLVW